jgi:peroxin-5
VFINGPTGMKTVTRIHFFFFFLPCPFNDILVADRFAHKMDCGLGAAVSQQVQHAVGAAMGGMGMGAHHADPSAAAALEHELMGMQFQQAAHAEAAMAAAHAAHAESQWASEFGQAAMQQHHHHQHHHLHKMPWEHAAEAAWGEAHAHDLESHFAAAAAGPIEGEGAEWAADFTHDGVQVFGLGTAPPPTVEEKQAASGLNRLMNDIRDGKAEVIDETREDVEGRENDEVEADGDALAEQFLAGMPPGPTFAEEFLNEDATAEQWADEMAEMDDDGFAAEFEAFSKTAGLNAEDAPYPFEKENPFLFHSDPFEEGMSLLTMGSLPDAVLAFEAACQKQPERIDAWQFLGTTQAENEKDALAITALRHARRLCPSNPHVLLALAACFTNEGRPNLALDALLSWLQSSDQFAPLEADVRKQHAARPLDDDDGNEYAKEFFFVDPQEHSVACDAFEAAIVADPINAELHVALGTLRHLVRDYDGAAAEFEKAVEIRPSDEKLWNKLGATLANGNRSAEAVAAYERALDLNPGFVRAQFNMGIALGHLQQHRLAATYLVRAIMMQSGFTEGTPEGSAGAESSPRQTTSSTREIWDVLRTYLSAMERPDLVQLSWSHDLQPFVREFGLSS